ncbi:MAG: PEP-CTERM sorting domain-containing protein [Proteobacteria bacterium]|nr:PEP-CTERM sorting domain-containing protein [Pseudomonadota bacterium]
MCKKFVCFCFVLVIVSFAGSVMAAPSPYAYSLDRFQVIGNLPGNIIDEFNDESIAPNWEVYDPTVVESGDMVTFRNPGTVGQITPNISSEMSYIGSMFNMEDGAGDYEGTSTWTNGIPGINQFYLMGMSGSEEDISISFANFGPAMSELFGIPTGPVILFDRFKDVETGDFDTQAMRVMPSDITGNILLRLSFDDVDKLYTGTYSLDGGATFLEPFAPIAPSDASSAPNWYLGAESFEVQAVPIPSTLLLLGSGLVFMFSKRNKR